MRGLGKESAAIADTSGQLATVWELSGRAAAESGGEFDRLFKEILKLLP